jgi:hypothetical protein
MFVLGKMMMDHSFNAGFVRVQENDLQEAAPFTSLCLSALNRILFVEDESAAQSRVAQAAAAMMFAAG